MTARLTTLRGSDRDESCALALNELFASRFSSLLADCGRDAEPGVVETEEWRDWDFRETTADQRRIEKYLNTLTLSGKRILHVGVGNSGFAKNFANKCEFIKGTTISDQELRCAKSLNIANYECIKENKYANYEVSGRFDIIVDNNPTGFACCWRHFEFMINKYCASMNADGMLLTDIVGLSWVCGNQPSNSGWSFSFRDWDAVARTQGFQCVAIDDFLIAWTRPGVKIPRLKHHMLQSLRRPVDLLRIVARKMRRKIGPVFRRCEP